MVEIDLNIGFFAFFPVFCRGKFPHITFGLSRRLLAPFGRCEGATHPRRSMYAFDKVMENMANFKFLRRN